jgi:hypothetical protein
MKLTLNLQLMVSLSLSSLYLSVPAVVYRYVTHPFKTMKSSNTCRERYANATVNVPLLDFRSFSTRYPMLWQAGSFPFRFGKYSVMNTLTLKHLSNCCTA